MRDELAERLLAKVMQWTREDVARERPDLQALASYKYDDYQQFAPGMRFVENLARWLRQFDEPHRAAAYRFVKEQLIFISASEMKHWVEMAYPDYIRPYLMHKSAQESGGNPNRVAQVARSLEFQIQRRQCLFLGLSDGARIDLFRRANSELSHEQIWQTHELAPGRVEKLLTKLRSDVAAMRSVGEGQCRFRTVVLLDDFTASGLSYLRIEDDGKRAGKIATFFKQATDTDSSISSLFNLEDLDVIVLLYAATSQAKQHLDESCEALWTPTGAKSFVETIQLLPETVRIDPATDAAMNELIDRYYDHSVFDEHFEKGGTVDAKIGFAACALPVVLHHNTPNNSIALLWSYDDRTVRGLFPRVTRHKEGA